MDSDEETTGYYNLSYGTEFVPLHNGTRLYVYESNANTQGINIYSAPDEGYAISYITGMYAPIVDETIEEVENGNGPFFISSRQAPYFNLNDIVTSVTTAFQMGAQGLNGYTRNAGTTTSVTATYKQRSERLPTLSESIYSINGTSYSSGDRANPGDTVIFAVTINKNAYEYLVNYEGELSSNLNGAVFIGTSPTGTGNNTTQSVTINTASSYNQTYYIKYVVPNDVSSNITSVVNWDYEHYGTPGSGDGQVNTAATYKKSRTMSDEVTLLVNGVQQNTYITVTKAVAGNMRNSDEYFKFLVTINGTSGDTYTILGQDSSVEYNGGTVNTSSTYTVGQTNYIYLKANQTVTIGLASNGNTTQVPVGITYSIAEQDAEEYVTTIDGVEGKSTGTLTTGSSNTINYTNTRDAAALTGVNIEISQYIIILISSAILIIITIKIKRKTSVINLINYIRFYIIQKQTNITIILQKY